MLTLVIKSKELYDNSNNLFITTEEVTKRFEFSLRAIFDWEAIWKIPYLGQVNLTREQMFSMFSCMCLDPPFDSSFLDVEEIDILKAYIADKPTATTVQNDDKGPSGKAITAEIVYGMMVSANIPSEYENWHFNRLLVLLAVIADTVAEKKPMTQQEILEQNVRLNEERKAKLKTKG